MKLKHIIKSLIKERNEEAMNAKPVHPLKGGPKTPRRKDPGPDVGNEKDPLKGPKPPAPEPEIESCCTEIEELHVEFDGLYGYYQIISSSIGTFSDFIIKDILKRPFITFGFISFVFLIPLVITSPKKMIKKLGYKVWKKIHYLIYPAALLSSLHFFMLVRANKFEPAIYIFIIIVLLLYRLYYKVIVPRLAQ